ncbi:hypothetical protein PIB30_043894 [Stylosanthes scabra]|uniref:NB-ARC domain-containing protein n=1 Tax=Stylosanthes scabra TaxID=79078 RepID=A0ABU6TGC7_9FABA|nr:hypothetical protein [Stylosanthes scabra]
MGGIGKTTIARAVYEAIRGEFKACCFMRNVREMSEKNGFVQLQRDLLASLSMSSSYFHDTEDGKNIIKNAFFNKKVLLVLDDVSEVKQLENLAEVQDWFGPGSRIIITARDMHLLDIHGVHVTYEAKGLDQEEAYNLFCLKAFKQLEPKEGYSSLSKEVVKYTKGLPLAVEKWGGIFVYEESPSNPGKRSRLWSKDDIHQVLINDMGTEAIRSMVLSFGHDAFYWFWSKPFEAHWSIEAFSKITQLRYLSLPCMELPLGLNHLPRSLKVLHWDFCPL